MVSWFHIDDYALVEWLGATKCLFLLILASNYFFYGESLVEQFGVVINRGDFLPFLVRHHRFISFAMYIIGEISSIYLQW